MAPQFANPYTTEPHRKPLRGLAAALPFFITTLGMILAGCGGGSDSPPPSISDLCAKERGTQKIINGTPCLPFEHTVARLNLFDEEDNTLTCSAVVISPHKILTAAHCFDEFVFRATVTAGGSSSEVVSVTYHPNARFIDNRFEHDLAIGLVEPPLEISVAPVALGPTPALGESVYIFGYGRTTVEESEPPLTAALSAGTMNVSAVSDLHIDAFYNGATANTCRGDSGGPAFTFATATQRLQLVGLVSSGTQDSCDTGDTSVFTNLANSLNRQFLQEAAPELE